MARVLRSRPQSFEPVPPHEMLPARTVVVPHRGEFFLRDSGETDPRRPTVMLLHGWIVTADLNWHGAYDALVDAGYRVLAIDHRGHGRGLRAMSRFRLADCAADAAAILRQLEAAPAIVVGYSMGGVIAQLMARDHPDVIRGLVLSATCQHFQDPETRRIWRWMGVVGLLLGLAPRSFYRGALRNAKIQLNERTAWWLVGNGLLAAVALKLPHAVEVALRRWRRLGRGLGRSLLRRGLSKSCQRQSQCAAGDQNHKETEAATSRRRFLRDAQ